MATYANQKSIIIKRTPKKEGEKFYHISQELLKSAMQNISQESTMKLFLYLSKNSNTVWNYSKEDFRNWTGLSTNMSKKAIDHLIEAGFLFPLDENGNKYIFYDSLELANEDQEIRKAEILKNKETPEQNGFVF